MTATSRINLATDPVFPQRDLLLDAREAARRLSGQLGSAATIRIDGCELLRVKYSPGESLRLLYRIQVGGASYTVAARAFTDGRSASVFERAKRTIVSCGPILPVARDAELDAVYWTFPNDRKITCLSALASPPEALANLRGGRWTHSRVVAYAPEKCVTAQCLGSERELLAYAKVYSDGERCSYDLYESLSKNILMAGSNLRVARALVYSKEHRTLLLEPVAGRRLADLKKSERADGFRRFGAALAALHGVPFSDDLSPFTRLDSDQLTKAARTIGRARPDVAELAGDLARKLCERRSGIDDPSVWLHGDVHPKNGILQGVSLTLIDMDQAGSGPAAADLGSLLAALCYSRCVGIMPAADERELAAAFLGGYGEGRELPGQNSLRWHAAAALLAERSLRAVNRVRPEGLRHMNDLLLSSWRLLTKGDYEY